MEKAFEAYLGELRAVHEDMKRAIEGLPVKALDWSPGPHMNSLSVLVVHSAGAQRLLIGEVVGGDPANRDRSEEFRAERMSAAELASRLDETLAHTAQVLEGLTLADLESSRSGPGGREVTVAWALNHALQHMGLHAGHAQITRQLWDQRQAQ
jgi:uncharacterized damage-inducible protein DinB